jgi:hypothetical protein
MSGLIIPRLIALDSSIIGNVARDFYHSNEHNQKKARHFLDYLSLKNLIPLITWHHIEELFQHNNEVVRDNRIRFIKSFPMIAWFSSVNSPSIVGSILDIQATELSLLIDNPSISLEVVIQKTKDKLLKFSSGQDLVSIFNYDQETWKQYRENLAHRQERRRKIASIGHAKFIDMKSNKFSDFINKRLHKPEETTKTFDILEANLERELLNHGDKKLSGYKSVAQEFINYVKKSGLQLYHAQGNAQNIFLKSFGIDPRDVSSDATLQDIGYTAIYKQKIRILAETFGLNYDLLNAIKEDLCPSWLIWRELDKVLKSAQHASGSDITDKYHSVLALYADILLVDKRFHEIFKQVARNAVIKKIINKVIKLSDYGNIMNLIGK